jgi:hypothetical protein
MGGVGLEQSNSLAGRFFCGIVRGRLHRAAGAGFLRGRRIAAGRLAGCATGAPQPENWLGYAAARDCLRQGTRLPAAQDLRGRGYGEQLL